MREFKFDPKRVLNPGQDLFPAQVARDPWVMFHGMSADYAGLVEARGFTRRGAKLPARETRILLEAFLELGWNGYRQGGFPTLQALFRAERVAGGSVCFGDTAKTSLPYATREYAGGESFRAVRIAIEDLEELDRQGPLRRPARSRLRARLRSLEALRERARGLVTSFPGGVIYAVKFTRKELDGLELNSWMGARAKAGIPPARIIAKMSVPPSFECDKSKIQRVASRFFEDPRGPGILLFREALRPAAGRLALREGCPFGRAYESLFTRPLPLALP
jgi:hypothetical protein